MVIPEVQSSGLMTQEMSAKFDGNWSLRACDIPDMALLQGFHNFTWIDQFFYILFNRVFQSLRFLLILWWSKTEHRHSFSTTWWGERLYLSINSSVRLKYGISNWDSHTLSFYAIQLSINSCVGIHERCELSSKKSTLLTFASFHIMKTHFC